MSQGTFTIDECAVKKKRTRSKTFPANTERAAPRQRLIGVIEPLYPTSRCVGRQPIGTSRMLRMDCLRQRYGHADKPLEIPDPNSHEIAARRTVYET